MVKGNPPESPGPRRPDSPNLDGLIALTHHRWAIPIVAELWGDTPSMGGCKFVTLLNRLEPSRDALSTTLTDLIQQGWVIRNPGIGHPLRPEYILTPRGKRIGRAAARLVRVMKHADVSDLGLRKWTLPILCAIAARNSRFNQLKAALRGITVRALALALKDLHDSVLISRTITDGFPPTPHYHLAPNAKRLTAAARSLAREIGLTLPPKQDTGEEEQSARRRRATA
jgi:DNA-binding HxlR family transcriptional regulator